MIENNQEYWNEGYWKRVINKIALLCPEKILGTQPFRGYPVLLAQGCRSVSCCGRKVLSLQVKESEHG